MEPGVRTQYETPQGVLWGMAGVVIYAPQNVSVVSWLWASYRLAIGWTWAVYRLAMGWLSDGYGLAMGWLSAHLFLIQ